MNFGGSVLFLAIDILGPDSTIEHVENFPGRDNLVRIRQLDCSCTTMNAHYQPEGTLQELRRRLRAVAALWPSNANGVGFLVGPSMMGIQVAPLSSLPPSLALWKALSLTLRARTRGVMVKSTRYPVLIAFSSAELRNFQCHAHRMGSVGDRSAPSDHIPVRFTIVCTRVKQQDHLVTQRWLAQHPLFNTALDEEHRNKMYDENRFIALNQFKEVAFSASTKARQAILTNTPTTQGAKLLVACTACRNGLTNTIRQCCET